MDNCFTPTEKLLDCLSVPYTKKHLKDSILSHPYHPSLLAIADTLEKYHIENIAVKIDSDKLREVPLPCIVVLSVHGQKLFVVLTSISAKEVSYYDHENKRVKMSTEYFLKKWTGVCLLAEKSEASREPEIEKRRAEKRFLNTLKISVFSFLLAWGVAGFTNSELLTSLTITIATMFYTLLKIAGLGVGLLLLWYEVDQYSPKLQSFCSGGSNSKINCNAVLNSEQAKILNGKVSLSVLGFSYFFAGLGTLLFAGYNYGTMNLLGIFSLMAVPVVLFSTYYQAIVIKQWCKFCIAVQAILVLEIATVLSVGFYGTKIILGTLPLFLALFLVAILSWKIIKPLMEKERETNLYKRGLKKIKNNPDVLQGLLSKSKTIDNTTEGLGITLNSENAKFDVIKVCNPYCEPCANAHQILEELFRKGTINLQILFTAGVDNEHMTDTVRHFLAIDAFGDTRKTQTALDDWYNANKKDYGQFANKHPLNGELAKQDGKIARMRSWCDAENITHTPTLFINGHELPKEYTVADLKEVLG